MKQQIKQVDESEQSTNDLNTINYYDIANGKIRAEDFTRGYAEVIGNSSPDRIHELFLLNLLRKNSEHVDRKTFVLLYNGRHAYLIDYLYDYELVRNSYIMVGDEYVVDSNTNISERLFAQIGSALIQFTQIDTLDRVFDMKSFERAIDQIADYLDVDIKDTRAFRRIIRSILSYAQEKHRNDAVELANPSASKFLADAKRYAAKLEQFNTIRSINSMKSDRGRVLSSHNGVEVVALQQISELQAGAFEYAFIQNSVAFKIKIEIGTSKPAIKYDGKAASLKFKGNELDKALYAIKLILDSFSKQGSIDINELEPQRSITIKTIANQYIYGNREWKMFVIFLTTMFLHFDEKSEKIATVLAYVQRYDRIR